MQEEMSLVVQDGEKMLEKMNDEMACVEAAEDGRTQEDN